MIKIEDLYFSYNIDSKHNNYVLNGLNLKINSGEFVSIMGSNGSGKSTLALCIKGILKPASGNIFIDGVKINSNKASYETRNKIGIVFQNPDNQFICTNVEREIAFGLENSGMHPEEMQNRIEEQLNKYMINKYRKNSPETLSGGEKQKVALASVLVTRPKYLILDEATSYLEPTERNKITNFLKKETHLKKDNGFTVILITQYPDEALISQRLIIMNQGKIIMDDKPGEVFKNVKELNKIGIRTPLEFEMFY